MAILFSLTANHNGWWNPPNKASGSLKPSSLANLLCSDPDLTNCEPRESLRLLLPLSFLKRDLDFRLHLCWLTSGRSTVSLPHLSSGTEAPLSCTTVGNRSMLLVGSSTCLPPGMFPGQRRIPGTRIPPSQFVDFPAAQRKEAKSWKHFLSSNLSAWLVSKQCWVGN